LSFTILRMKNFIIKLFLNSIAVVMASYLLRDHIHVFSYGYAVLVAITLSILNVSVKPLLVLFTLPATILSLGLFLLFINTAIIELAAYLIGPGFEVDSWWWAFFFSILLSILNSILESLIKRPNQTISRENDVKIYDKDGNRVA
jgi:putative membrane protein